MTVPIITDRVVDNRHTHKLSVITVKCSLNSELYISNVNFPPGETLLINSAIMGHNINTIIGTTAIR